MNLFSREDAKPRRCNSDEAAGLERVAAAVVDASLRLHRAFGPGLLESFYETALAADLRQIGLEVEQQVAISATYAGHELPAFRADLVVGNCLIVEVKSVEQLQPVHAKQLLTNLRLTRRPLGLLVNFGAATFVEGVRRVVNQHDFASSRLRVNQKS